jgi:hypothetical protein
LEEALEQLNICSYLTSREIEQIARKWKVDLNGHWKGDEEALLSGQECLMLNLMSKKDAEALLSKKTLDYWIPVRLQC